MDGDPSTSHVREISHGQEESNRSATSIPDDVLLDIFDFYRNNNDYSLRLVWKWHILVHVCQRWRQVVFASPRRLKIQILCTRGTPVRKNLGIWPAFPIVLDYHYLSGITPYDEDNAVAALEHPDRVRSIRLYVTGSQLGRIAAGMLVPFPALTRLDIRSFSSWGGNTPVRVLPAEFLRGSAPCLQELTLSGISFPALGTLLLTTNVLVKLELFDVPPTGYISPEEMVACLAALPKLECFAIIVFPPTAPRLDRSPPPLSRTVLSALTSFEFKGASEYLEDLVAQIDSPQLKYMSIIYLNQLADIRLPQFSEFIVRSMGPRLTPLRCADVRICRNKVSFTLHCHANFPGWDWRHSPVCATVSYEVSHWHVAHLALVLNQCSAALSNVVHLKLEGNQVEWEGTDAVHWLHLLHRFSSMQTLHVSRDFAGNVALALEGITEEISAEVLPTLDLIYLEARRHRLAPSVEKFVAVRRRSGRPITVVDTRTEFNNRLESYITK